MTGLGGLAAELRAGVDFPFGTETDVVFGVLATLPVELTGPADFAPAAVVLAGVVVAGVVVAGSVVAGSVVAAAALLVAVVVTVVLAGAVVVLATVLAALLAAAPVDAGAEPAALLLPTTVGEPETPSDWGTESEASTPVSVGAADPLVYAARLPAAFADPFARPATRKITPSNTATPATTTTIRRSQ